jgi:prepilin-type N-terminal cleavage/methylation domain-containing protein
MKRARAGFTLIELTVVITIVLFLALLVTPNMVAVKRSRDRKTSEAALLRLPAEAREEASKSGRAIVLRLEENNTLVLERAAESNTNSTSATPTLGVSDGTGEEFKRLTLSSGMQVELTGNSATNTNSLETWKVYPDGTTGSNQAIELELTEGDKTKVLVIPSQGLAYWQENTGQSDSDKATPNTQNSNGTGNSERWAAGELERRA